MPSFRMENEGQSWQRGPINLGRKQQQGQAPQAQQQQQAAQVQQASQAQPPQQNRDPQPAQQPQQDDRYAQARKELYDMFVQDMSDTALSYEYSDDEAKRAAKRYKATITRRNVLFGLICFSLVSLVAFGAYGAFFKHELTYDEIALIANTRNGKTNFPEAGVYGYLQTHVPDLALEMMESARGAGVRSIEVGEPVLTRLVPRSNYFANAYFYVDVISENGAVTLDGMLPVYWNEGERQYQLGGQVIWTPNAQFHKSEAVVDNPFLSFDDVEPASKADVESARSFVSNFFVFLYGGEAGTIDPYYEGNPLDPGSLKFVSMDDFHLYSGMNRNGYNALAVLTLRAENGVQFTTQKYMVVDRIGGGWKIKGVL